MPIWFALYRVLWQGDGVPEGSALSNVLADANAALYQVDAEGNLTASLKEGVDIAAEQFSNVTFLGINLLVRPSAAVDFGNILGSLPYILLIAIIVVAGFYQQVQTTRRRDTNGQQEEPNQQMQTMQRALRIMPIVFGFISWNFVSGLGLYFATSNVFRVGQQAVILRTAAKDDGDGQGRGKQSPEDPPEDEPKSSGPSPNASKKRNRRRRK